MNLGIALFEKDLYKVTWMSWVEGDKSLLDFILGQKKN